MPSPGFVPIPDWFSWENQGTDVAVADITGNGQVDLVVLMVDSPPGPNQATYRIGRDVDGAGNVTGGWGPWHDIPDWFSWENQGAGVAVADITGNGKLDLVVLMVDSPPGPNQAKYRIGRDLDVAGNVTGGWGPWHDIPDWFSWENQGAGVAVADITGNGELDLVVLMVDSPARAEPSQVPHRPRPRRGGKRHPRLGTMAGRPRLVLVGEPGCRRRRRRHHRQRQRRRDRVRDRQLAHTEPGVLSHRPRHRR